MVTYLLSSNDWFEAVVSVTCCDCSLSLFSDVFFQKRFQQKCPKLTEAVFFRQSTDSTLYSPFSTYFTPKLKRVPKEPKMTKGYSPLKFFVSTLSLKLFGTKWSTLGLFWQQLFSPKLKFLAEEPFYIFVMFLVRVIRLKSVKGNPPEFSTLCDFSQKVSNVFPNFASFSRHFERICSHYSEVFLSSHQNVCTASTVEEFVHPPVAFPNRLSSFLCLT